MFAFTMIVAADHAIQDDGRIDQAVQTHKEERNYRMTVVLDDLARPAQERELRWPTMLASLVDFRNRVLTPHGQSNSEC